jgi:hypothetical protein
MIEFFIVIIIMRTSIILLILNLTFMSSLPIMPFKNPIIKLKNNNPQIESILYNHLLNDNTIIELKNKCNINHNLYLSLYIIGMYIYIIVMLMI